MNSKRGQLRQNEMNRCLVMGSLIIFLAFLATIFFNNFTADLMKISVSTVPLQHCLNGSFSQKKETMVLDPAISTQKKHVTQGLLSEARVHQITYKNKNIVYLHPPVDIILVTMPKSGTTTTFNWLYPGVSGKPSWDSAICKAIAQEIRSSCWKPYASYLYDLPIKHQIELLTHVSNSQSLNIRKATQTLRVAIQRNPYDRLVSSFKSKFTCGTGIEFNTDLYDRRKLVPSLRRRCKVPSPPRDSEFSYCVNISEFAMVLDQCRTRKDVHVENLDQHIRPQQFFFNEIDYDMVIDVTDLSDASILKPIIDRIPKQNRFLVENGAPHLRSSGTEQLNIPEKAARMLHSFALQSFPGKYKYLV